MAIFGNRIRVGDLLVQRGYITEEQLTSVDSTTPNLKMGATYHGIKNLPSPVSFF